VLFQALLALVTALGHVDVHRDAELLGHRRPGGEHPRAGRVDGVRRGLHERASVPADLVMQRAHVLRGAVGRLLVAGRRARPVVHRAGQDDSDADLPGGLDHGHGVLVPAVVQVEEVGHGRDAHASHLREVEPRAGPDRVAVEALRERIEDAVAPRHERQVVAVAAEEGLERVRVRVHRPGDDGDVAPVLAFLVRIVVRQLGGRSDGGDARTLQDHAVVAFPPAVGEHQASSDERHAPGCITQLLTGAPRA
jgi:hypothetical protein